MKIAEQTGSSETQVWETGKAYWLAANPPNTMHSDINVGNQPIEVMVKLRMTSNRIRSASQPLT